MNTTDVTGTTQFGGLEYVRMVYVGYRYLSLIQQILPVLRSLVDWNMLERYM